MNKKILDKIGYLKSEFEERVKDPRGYGNSYENGVDTGWFEALTYMEVMINQITKENKK